MASPGSAPRASRMRGLELSKASRPDTRYGALLHPIRLNNPDTWGVETRQSLPPPNGRHGAVASMSGADSSFTVPLRFSGDAAAEGEHGIVRGLTKRASGASRGGILARQAFGPPRAATVGVGHEMCGEAF